LQVASYQNIPKDSAADIKQFPAIALRQQQKTTPIRDACSFAGYSNHALCRSHYASPGLRAATNATDSPQNASRTVGRQRAVQLAIGNRQGKSRKAKKLALIIRNTCFWQVESWRARRPTRCGRQRLLRRHCGSTWPSNTERTPPCPLPYTSSHRLMWSFLLRRKRRPAPGLPGGGKGGGGEGGS
jgi:hypothetical protein